MFKGRTNSNKRDIHGVVLLDKPIGSTSNRALQAVKRLYRARKAGHTGSLDPLASGLLPICLGEATKISAFLLDADKSYRVRCRLGAKTDTGDADGTTVARAGVPDLNAKRVEAALARFQGPIMQVPPMYSAMKHQGRRLYELAREGVEVERAPRPVTIHAIALRELGEAQFEFDVTCSKGTYVRTLAEDIAETLNTLGYVTALRRLAAGPYRAASSITVDALEARAERGLDALDEVLLPVASAVAHWPEVRLGTDSAYYLRKGQSIFVPRAPTQGWVRIYTDAGAFLGVGEIQSDGKIAPRRLIRQRR
jgi:tRNA pseudouridine55 synthase